MVYHGFMDIESVFKNSGFSFSSAQIHLIETYASLLKSWNEKINLVSFSSEKEFLIKHILDSAYGVRAFEFLKEREVVSPKVSPVLNILDLGTGGGLPGIILAILLHKHHFTLLDARRKKIIALSDIVSHLKLKNVECLWARAETLPKNCFDIVVARAIFPCEKLFPFILPILKPQGYFIAYKGPKYEKELRETHSYFESKKLSLVKIFPYHLKSQAQEDLGHHFLLLCQKLFK